MTFSASRQIDSDQREPDKRLARLLARHRSRPFARPVAAHTADAVDWLLQRLDPERPLLLDSGCGTGQSARLLAAAWPQHQVVGIDRSAHRLGRGGWREPGLQDDRLILLRADLVDCWRLLLAHGVAPDQHFLLYPNPYPKPSQLARRWHAHPVFPTLVALGGRLELRSNWRIYAEEFALGLQLMGVPDVSFKLICPQPTLSPFESKYLQSDHQLFQVVARLPSAAAIFACD